jgi:hypothetical protein
MSNVRFVLDDVFPGDILNKKSYNLYKNIKIIEPVKENEGVNDNTLQLLVKNVRTSPEKDNTDDYVPGLLIVDLGYQKNDLITTEANLDNNNVSKVKEQVLNRKDIEKVGNLSNEVYQALSLNYEENIYKKNIDKEGHCAFFNAAHAIFSNAKQYLLLRYVVSMFYNILSKMSTMGETSTSNSWLTVNIYYDIPKRLAEFYFNDNLAFDECDANIEHQIMTNASDLFGFDILGVDDYYEKMLNGSNLEKKTLLHKVAMCYTQPNFYGNASTFIVLGHLFGVRFGVLQALAKSEAHRLKTKDHKSNVYVQDFGINFPSMGCDFDFVEPFFDEDINLQSKSYECHEFWLALTAGNNHYVHFSDSNFDLRNNERLGPINNLEHLTNSIWNKCISKFLLMSRNYQRPTNYYTG